MGTSMQKFVVRSYNRFEAIYEWQCNDVIVTVTSRIRHGRSKHRTTECSENISLYVPNSLHYTWRVYQKSRTL